jgi:solute carrier family 66, member 2
MMSLLFDFSNSLVKLGMATAPVTGYIMQYRLILLNKSVGAFSIDICLVLLFANIMRLNFYIFRHYETALLFQSLFMITAQLLLVRICTLYHRPNPKQETEHQLRPETGLATVEQEDFWRWSSFDIYGMSAGI